MNKGMRARLRLLVDVPSRRARLGLALLSALLFSLSLPPVDLGLVLGWIALVPLALAVRGLTPGRAMLLGGVFGLAAAHLVFAWMFRFSAFRIHHGLLLGGYLALFPAAAAVALARFGSEARGLVLVPAAFIAAEWARGHAGFLAVPWATFGQTQHENVAFLQLAALGGEPLVGLGVVAANVAIAQLCVKASPRAPALLALSVVAAAHALGALSAARAIDGAEITVAAVQPAILPKKRTPESFERLLELTRAAAAREPGELGLVVWPETAAPAIEGDLETKLAIRDVVEELHAPIVFGSSETEKLSASSAAHRSFNAAYLMEPGRPVAPPYRKVKLLPFAEYRPVDLPAWIAPPMFDTEPGERRVTLRAEGLVVEPVICWENLFADEVHATATDEPSVIAHVVNDAWFGPTAQPELHDLVSALRAVESGRPVVIASNTGPSWIVDARGRVVARTPRTFEPAVVTASVRMPSGRTTYRLYGDAVWAIPLLAAAVALLVRRRPSPARRGADDQVALARGGAVVSVHR